MFGARFDETMEIAAREVSVEVTLPWYFKMREFYGEEYSTDPELVDPQHLAPGDVMVFQQVLEACDASVVSPDDVVGLKVKWKTPLAHLDDSTELEVSLGELLEADQAPMRKARAIIAYARALQGELMVYEALALVSEALADGSDADLEEIQSLLEPFVEPIVDPTAEPTAEP
jgi:Ca-activated chloride channel family protein